MNSSPKAREKKSTHHPSRIAHRIVGEAREREKRESDSHAINKALVIRWEQRSDEHRQQQTFHGKEGHMQRAATSPQAVTDGMGMGMGRRKIAKWSKSKGGIEVCKGRIECRQSVKK